MRIHNKLTIAYLLTNAIPIIVLSMLFIKQAESLIINRIGDSYQTMVSQQNSSISFNLQLYESIANHLMLNPDIQSLLSDPSIFEDKGIITVNKEIYAATRFMRAYRESQVEEVGFYYTKDYTYSDGQFIFPMSALRDDPHFDTFNNKKPMWYLEHDAFQDKYFITYFRAIFSYEDSVQIGYLKMKVNLPSIVSIDSDLTQQLGNVRFHIVNENGTTIYDADSSLIGQPSLLQLVQKEASPREAEVIYQDDDRYFVWHQQLEPLGWVIALSVPTESMDEPIHRMRTYVLISGAIACAVFTVISYLLTQQITNGIRKLRNKVGRVAKGFQYPASPATGKDEISILDRSFDDMLNSLSKLIHENYSVSLKKRDMELQLLQSQINPHFLYNTLEFIKSEIDLMECDTDMAVKMIVKLGDLFRVSVSQGKHFIPFSDELYHANCYLDIVQIRSQSKFDVEWEIDPAVKRFYTLKIILQPILENAIQHGLEALTDRRGLIRITAYIKETKIVVDVIDNGVGMEEDKLLQLQHPSDSDNQSGVGLFNVSRRLKTYFGDMYGLTISSQAGMGTTVSYCLPVVDSDQDIPITEGLLKRQANVNLSR
ncbi:sensor histidine kinase [Paenibacillus sp. J5C_2022]|uniref:sensor histidine kinase n=1 Tax=Paenibacillus sp. J5C2022 TaxID=2977129 RepID=UPI0021CEE56B|nr:sensor histidine kinase [Paenibacillus sp. J5C2022]MCU6708577.1 sensor histidine kinase [Paenibacillus sp. J5C2022]